MYNIEWVTNISQTTLHHMYLKQLLIYVYKQFSVVKKCEIQYE